MKLHAASVLALGLGLAAVSASQAMPVAPLGPAQAESEDVIQVAQGCGACRPLYSCPPGWHTGPFGRRCFPNRRW